MNETAPPCLSVLVAEDEPLVAMDIEDALEEAGLRIVGPASSVPRALQMIGESRFDAALLDVNLRGERIDPVADALAGLGIPFIFITGHGADGLPERHRDRPVVSKPFRVADLTDTLLRHVCGS